MSLNPQREAPTASGTCRPGRSSPDRESTISGFAAKFPDDSEPVLEVLTRPTLRRDPEDPIRLRVKKIRRQNCIMCIGTCIATLLFIILIMFIYFFSPYNHLIPQTHLKYPE
jgi:hypothetical protein